MIRKLAMLLLLLGSCFAAEVYMLDFRLEPLRGGKAIDLNDFKGKMLFLTFFKSDCLWCGKQLTAFNAVLQGPHAGEIRVVAVAMGGDAEVLKAKSAEAAFPVLKASEALLSGIGGVKMTPYTLIADRAGNFATKIVGYQDEDQIESIINQLGGNR
jgi:thioredoxin-related protein